MKQNIIMIIILVILFLFGLLIYDFSDELDKSVSDHNWYRIENNELTVISFKNQVFSYYYVETKKPVSLFELCTSFRYNRSIKVIKLSCNIKENKLYVASVDDKKLTITINGVENVFYINESEAIKADFIKKNNLNEEQFGNLMNTSLSEFNTTTTDDIVNLFNAKKNQLVAFVTKELTIQNALNLKALHNFISNTNTNVFVLDIDSLEASEIEKFSKINIKISEIIKQAPNSISLYNIGNKKHELITGIEVKAFNEVDGYQIKEVYSETN
ncbi:MAG: hypothetical protein PHF30_01540 [Bacilli bacterium]|nr:hypothetical protein [Bacilli bacterium]